MPKYQIAAVMISASNELLLTTQTAAIETMIAKDARDRMESLLQSPPEDGSEAAERPVSGLSIHHTGTDRIEGHQVFRIEELVDLDKLVFKGYVNNLLDNAEAQALALLRVWRAGAKAAQDDR